MYTVHLIGFVMSKCAKARALVLISCGEVHAQLSLTSNARIKASSCEIIEDMAKVKITTSYQLTLHTIRFEVLKTSPDRSFMACRNLVEILASLKL